MNQWFEEFWNNNTGTNRFISTSFFSPSSGEIYLHSLLGTISCFLALYNFTDYFAKQDVVIAVLLSILALGVGIAGLILSFKNLTYSIRCKSLYKVCTVIVGILLSLAGIIAAIALVVIIIYLKTHT